ncbi:MAG: hypothetical protein PVJ63_07375 [Thioalkalispiraceae bacterium]
MRGLLFLILGSLFLFWFAAYFWQTQRRRAYTLLAIGSCMLILAAVGFFKIL